MYDLQIKTASPFTWIIADRDNLEHHIENQDYFGTLATIIDLIRQDNDASIARIKQSNKTLQGIKKDLMKLQKEYRIEK